MSIPRFFVDLELAEGADLVLPAAAAHHAVRVLRLRPDDPMVLFNGRGGEFEARLQVVRKEEARAQVGRFRPIERESSLAVTLIQAWVATEKLDWIVEKAVELGAVRIVLMPAERSVVRLHGDRRERRLTHLRQLAIAACEQCGRNRVPTLAVASDLAAALATAGDCPRFVLLPDATAALPQLAPATMRDVTTGPAPLGIALVVGPEGGFASSEVAHAQALGCRPARLGPRVLRTETAGLAALAALQATCGDLHDAAGA
jgi:16S rRNA (uracil1498-N3)-methyltransferase